jgi:hypothetical protein
LPDSGIWSLENDVSLPDSRKTWQFSLLSPHSPLPLSSPGRVLSTGSTKVQSYFLAEIAMRRMLRRCTTSIRLSADGKLVYAPVDAADLEFQLDEWYSYLPRLVYFERDKVMRLAHKSTDGALENFLQTQYYLCKTAIYWPAVYQAIEFGEANKDLLAHC